MSAALYDKIAQFQDSGDQKSKDAALSAGLPNKTVPVATKIIKGHQRKVYCVGWAGDSKHVATGGQEGFVLVTDTTNMMKLCAPVKAPFVMAAALSDDAKTLVVRSPVTRGAESPSNPLRPARRI